MKTQNGFTKFIGRDEISKYLDSKRTNRKITKIQIHHMAAPSYSTWNETDKRLWPDEPHFGRTNSLNSYGKDTWDSRDENGKYIAQHFNIFPDGVITSGRSLNNTPIGIRGWNDNAICIEIYGNFDKGKDIMTDNQRKSVIELVGELCKQFNINPNANTIRYHAWFTSGGKYIGNYVAGQSGKTCPGTGFFGGNTSSSYEKNFLPEIKKYISGENTDSVKPEGTIDTNRVVRVTADVLNIRNGPSANNDKVGEIKKGEAYTIIKMNGEWGYLKSGVGWIHLGYTEIISDTPVFNNYVVRVTTDVLNIRKHPDASSEKVGQLIRGDAYTIIKETGEWGLLKYETGWIHLGYTEKV